MRWPLTLQYEHRFLDAHGAVTQVERHEFSGRSWTDWTDIRLSVQWLPIEGESVPQAPVDREVTEEGLAYHEFGDMQVERYTPDGNNTIGYVTDPAPLADDGFVKPSLYSASLATPSTTSMGAGNEVAPNYVFNGRFGFVPPDSISVVVSAPADEALRRSEVGSRLNIPTDELVAIAVKLWDCGEVPQRDCQDSDPVQQREVVLHPELGIPLQASATGRDFGGGTETIEVTGLRATPTHYS